MLPTFGTQEQCGKGMRYNCLLEFVQLLKIPWKL
ncbi:hypothetical protein SLEP1_g7476 [Rubroshorea leprosula]|uniref:Uncharacterized protein n=1 Tax=Rubroshorea leprosula TaxID=152421 RepID=A0AAV5I9G6_9ROSI|nr:hypothetical protein SLEP1_g7476 [Rubroshorea leprosula]